MTEDSVLVIPSNAATVSVTLVKDETTESGSLIRAYKEWRVTVQVNPGWRFVNGSVIDHRKRVDGDGVVRQDTAVEVDYSLEEPLIEDIYTSKDEPLYLNAHWYTGAQLRFEEIPDSSITVSTESHGPGTTHPVSETRHGHVGMTESFVINASGGFLYWADQRGKIISWSPSTTVHHRYEATPRSYAYTAHFVTGGGGGVTPGGHGGEPGDETKYAYISVTLGHSPSDGGSTSPSGTTVYCGTPGDSLTVQMSATPTDGFKFVKWTKDGSEVSTSASYETTLVFPDIGYVDSYTFNAEFEEEEEPKTGSIRLVCVPQPLSLDRFSVNPTVSEKTGSVGDSLSWFVSASVNRGFKALYRFVEWRDDVTGDVVLSSKTGNVSKTVTKADEREDWVLRAVFEEVGTTGLPLYDSGTGEILFGSDGRVLCDA